MIRRATYDDLDTILSIVRSAQLSLRELGIDQWQDGYPTAEVIRADIDAGVGYVSCYGELVVGYAAIITTGEEAYRQIEELWRYKGDYVAVHRLCVDGEHRRCGVALKLMSYAVQVAHEARCRAFRIDTHRGNIRMLSMLQKQGFEYVGIVRYESGERVAYELNLY